MCGISGVINYGNSTDTESLIQSMNKVLAHRGPDGAGFFQHENVVIGHTRLAIIDLSASANQPLFNEDRTVAVVFNGEIYNFQELRQTLTKLGHRFATKTDSEVIVHAWEEYGADCVNHFRGMFAFCILDTAKKELFLGRDRLGKKPLYFSFNRSNFAFSSEIKALLQLPDVSNEIDPVSLGEFASYGYYTGTRSIYKSVRKIPPGSCITINYREKPEAISPQRYWKVSLASNQQCSDQEWLARLDATLTEAVRLRMVSDVPVGAFLSGGIDSSLITAYMAKVSPGRVKTFTIGFHEASHDESRYAQAVADYLGTEHTMEVVSPDALSLLPEIMEAYDEPFGDFSAIPTFYLCKMTKKEVTVALSGDGGDELFLGYDRYHLGRNINNISTLIGLPGRKIVAGLARSFSYGSRMRRFFEALSLNGPELYNYLAGFRQERLSLLRPDIVNQMPPNGSTSIQADYAEYGAAPLPMPFQYCDINNYLPEDILYKVDRASMHHSLEVRCPLLDHEFVELAATMPTSLNVSGGKGKRILRHLAGTMLPSTLLDRPKQGFGMPLKKWFKNDLKDMLAEMTSNQASPMWHYFDRDEVMRRIMAHQANKVIDSSAVIWRLLFYYYWCEGNR